MNPSTLPLRSDIRSNLRCPRSRCVYYGKRLSVEVGQHETAGDIDIQLVCLGCGYRERGSRRPSVAAKSPYMRELLDRVRGRDEGIEVPMRTDLPAVVEVADAP